MKMIALPLTLTLFLAVAGCDSPSASEQAKSATQALHDSPTFQAEWRRVCDDRAKVYRAMAKIKADGVLFSEAISRASPLEDQQKTADLKRVGVSNYVEAVTLIYGASDTPAAVRQLNEECLASGKR